MAAKARGANFDSNHGYWVLTDKEYQDSQAKDAQIAILAFALDHIASGSYCQTEGCDRDNPLCDAMYARAAIQEAAEVTIKEVTP